MVTLTVTDNDGNVVSECAEVKVASGLTAPSRNSTTTTSRATTVEFYDNSYDDEAIASWLWDFGDGTRRLHGGLPDSRLPAPGDYEVTLTVTDDDGKSSSVTYTVFVD